MPLDLPRLPVLRVLELEISLGCSPGLSSSRPCPQRSPPSRSSASPFTAPFLTKRIGPDRAGPLPLFDDACTYRAKLPSLRRVHYRGRPDRPVDQEDYAAFHVFILERFPGLWGTGILEISAGPP
ncbi:hypothetical protein B0H14DRAFT_3487395 [Mycena olivaceomarginata]|nr:hypothetical protein B0H14DRAFT_3487395 [Mycena olivaceomarginata]